MSFSFSLFARQRERKERKERENTPQFPTLLRVFDKMDVAGEPALSARYRSYTLHARGANVVQLRMWMSIVCIAIVVCILDSLA